MKLGEVTGIQGLLCKYQQLGFFLYIQGDSLHNSGTWVPKTSPKASSQCRFSSQGDCVLREAMPEVF